MPKEFVDKVDSISLSSTYANHQFGSIKRNIINSLPRLSSSDLLIRDQVIQHIGQSIRDISEIELIPQLNIKELDEKLKGIMDQIYDIQKDVISKKNSAAFVNFVEHYLCDVVDLIGSNWESISLVSSMSFSSDKYLKTHTMNVLLVCISTAMKLSKCMKDKLLQESTFSHFDKVMICNKKVFTKNELINLSMAAIFHNIYLISQFPNLHKDTKLLLRDQSLFEKHPSESYYILKVNLDAVNFDIQRTVYQQHEYIDGSGFPNGIDGHLFSRYSLVLSFALHYVMRTIENPVHPYKHPYTVIYQMLHKERSKFDSDVLISFVRAMSFYPVGCWVLLNTGDIGIVFQSNENQPMLPIVKVLFNSKFKKIQQNYVDTCLSETKIQAAIPSSEIRKRFPEYLPLFT